MLRSRRSLRLEARGHARGVLLSQRVVRGKNHSSLGGRKAYLNFELKDRRRPEAARLWRVLDFKVQTRSGLPCDEWVGVAGAADIVEVRPLDGILAHRDFAMLPLALRRTFRHRYPSDNFCGLLR
jgi:hypothetical protein